MPSSIIENPPGKAYLDEAPFFPFSSYFANSDWRVLIRKLCLLNPLFSPASPLHFTYEGLRLQCFACKPESSVGSVSGLASSSCADTMHQEVH